VTVQWLDASGNTRPLLPVLATIYLRRYRRTEAGWR